MQDAAKTVERLPVKGLPSVGYRTTKVLAQKNILTCADLQRVSLESLRNMFGEKNGLRLYEYSRGVDKREWNQVVERKTISAQISWGVRMADDSEVKEFLEQLSVKVVDRLIKVKSKQVGAKSITLKIWRAIENADPKRRKGHLGHGQCDILNRKASLSVPTNDPKLIAKKSFLVYKEMKVVPERVRGLGIALSGFGKPYSLLHTGFLKRKAQAAPVERPEKASAKEAHPSMSPVRGSPKSTENGPKTRSEERRPLGEEAAIERQDMSGRANVVARMNLSAASFSDMQEHVVAKLREVKLAALLLPHLQEVECEEDFCDGECSSRKCFQTRLLDRCADLLSECCENLNGEEVSLIRAVRRVVTLLWPDDEPFTSYWDACCTQLEYEISNSTQPLGPA